jgi:hypothetical protein
VKLNKIFSIILGLSLPVGPISFAQDRPTPEKSIEIRQLEYSTEVVSRLPGDWKRYDGDRGEHRWVNMASIRHVKYGAVVIEIITPSVDGTNPEALILDCRGHYTFYPNTGGTEPFIGWRSSAMWPLVVPITKDVCATR